MNAKQVSKKNQSNPIDLPTVSRPQIPTEYGIPKHNKGLLPWSHVTDRMTQAMHYWICTVGPDSRPHVTRSMVCGSLITCILVEALKLDATAIWRQTPPRLFILMVVPMWSSCMATRTWISQTMHWQSAWHKPPPKSMVTLPSLKSTKFLECRYFALTSCSHGKSFPKTLPAGNF